MLINTFIVTIVACRRGTAAALKAHLELGDEYVQIAPAQALTEGSHHEGKLAGALLQVFHPRPGGPIPCCNFVMWHLQHKLLF